jgi:peptidoglycan/LPS O-acetylase OafA/YrhL
MPERFDGGRALAGVGGIVLIVSLFLAWFTPAITAWDAFEVLDLVLAFLALVIIVHAVPPLARTIRAPEEPSGLFPAIGIVAFILVAAALVNHPPAALGHRPALGAWLALGGTALMAIGGVLSAARISVVVSVRPRSRTTGRRRTTVAEPAASEPYDSETETRTFPETGRG